MLYMCEYKCLNSISTSSSNKRDKVDGGDSFQGG